MPETNICIIGAGVVGLAIAARLAKHYDGVFVLEKNKKFGQETSSRNSEVIHSGIYYPANSLKAGLCVRGRQLLYDYCAENDILFNKCGKLIVANNAAEKLKLEQILRQARNNGVDDGRMINKAEIATLEPAVQAPHALFFPSSGILDSHGLMKQLAGDALAAGAQIVFNSKVVCLKPAPAGEEEGFLLEVLEEDGSYSFSAATVVNAAGLHASDIAAMAGVDDLSYQQHYWKGEYFAVGNGKAKMINRLVYPVPEVHTTGLGVHATIDLNGGMKLGPNAIYLEGNSIDYSVNRQHQRQFYESAASFLPFIEYEDLHPDQAGIRPKLQKPGDDFRDFIICHEKQRGMPGLINLIGIESPGLTASLAIAGYVQKLLSPCL